MGTQLKAARKARGWSLEDAIYELRARHELKTTAATLHRMEQSDTDELACNSLLVAGLANMYGLELEALSAHHARERDRMLGVLVPDPNRWVARDLNPEPAGSRRRLGRTAA